MYAYVRYSEDVLFPKIRTIGTEHYSTESSLEQSFYKENLHNVLVENLLSNCVRAKKIPRIVTAEHRHNMQS